jgi:hypothetical protein
MWKGAIVASLKISLWHFLERLKKTAVRIIGAPAEVSNRTPPP